MTSPADRATRFNLRLSEDEKAAAEDLQSRRGGPEVASLNTVIADAVSEIHWYRISAVGLSALPISDRALRLVRDTADELGITLHDAMEHLIMRGAPHQPQKACWNPAALGAGGDALPVPVHPQGRTETPNGPRYAKPRPTGLPPVPPVPGQDAITITEGETS